MAVDLFNGVDPFGKSKVFRRISMNWRDQQTWREEESRDTEPSTKTEPCKKKNIIKNYEWLYRVFKNLQKASPLDPNQARFSENPRGPHGRLQRSLHRSNGWKVAPEPWFGVVLGAFDTHRKMFWSGNLVGAFIYFSSQPFFGKFTNIFARAWNHQPVLALK